MNHDRPLFGDNPTNGPGLDPRGNVALKQAVNYAVDRIAMLEQRGASAGVVTDQHMPLSMPGFHDSDIYPARPDLVKARELAGCNPDCPSRQDGVLYCSNRAPAPSTCQIVQSNLREIGLELEIKLFPRATQFELAGRRGEPFDMTLEGWHADQLDPQTFFQLLDGTTIRPANNTNFAYFNDPEYNRRIAEADALPSPARESAFGLLDAEIARDAAPSAAVRHSERQVLLLRQGRVSALRTRIHAESRRALPPARRLDRRRHDRGGERRDARRDLSIRIDESAPTDFPVSVDYSTSDGTADSTDYRPVTGTVTFESAEAKTIAVDVTGDTTHEPDETFFVRLSNATKGTIVHSRLSESSRTTMRRHLRRRRLPCSIRRHLSTRFSGARATGPA